jgi:hypothetical protein
MFDIFFISFNEYNQEKNWKRVLELHPDAIRIHGIKGIDTVHLLCDKNSTTDYFWTIDGDNFLIKSLDWNISNHINTDLFLFDAIDPISNQTTSLGGVKLWRKSSIINPNMDKGDFCLNATNSKSVIHETFSITQYNSTPYEAWKTAFRHCVKLKSKLFENRKFAKNIDYYIAQWENCKNLNNGSNNADWAYKGLQDAEKYVKDNNEVYENLLKINDYRWLKNYFNSMYQNEKIEISNIDYSFAASLIPSVMNALYKDEVLKSTNLKEIRDAFRIKQLQSKTLLLDKLKKIVSLSDRILVIGSWFGFTSYCLYNMGYQHITEVDIDDRLECFSNHLNRFNKNFNHITANINDIDTSKYDVIINTSCEHILENKWFDNISNNSLIFLQSTDYTNWDHINISNTLEDMVSKYPMDLIEKSTLDFNGYKRFTVVGRKLK